MTEEPEPRFQSCAVLRMFPVFVWKAQLTPDIYNPINDSVMQVLGEIGTSLDDLGPGESWQSDHGLHEIHVLRPLVDCIDDAAERVFDYLEIAHQGFTITGCWANANAPGAGHRTHSHPNNYLSGVYYVRTYPDADTINFHDPRPQAGVIRPPARKLTVENTDQVVVRVEDGMLLIFPAWFEHSVDPNRSGQVRISLGFNIMFTDYAETMTRPMWISGKRSQV